MPKSVFLIVDMLTPYDFPGAEALLPNAPGVVARIDECRRSLAGRDVPVVFANDIDDRFSGSRDAVLRNALEGAHPELVRPLQPEGEDCFLHKGQHSAFYGTPLAHLLHEWNVDELILTGQVTEQCILYTALDAHVRHYDLRVPTDCVLSMDAGLGEAALRMMERNMGAELISSAELTAS